MSRLILILELVLGVLAFSIYLEGGDILSLVALSPLLLILLFPPITALAIWPLDRVITAFRVALGGDSLKRGDPVSAHILDFCEKTSLHGVFIGLTVGLVILLWNSGKLSFNLAYRVGIHAATGMIAALIAVIVLKQASGIFRKKNMELSGKNRVPPDALRQLCERYGITRREKEIIGMIAGGSTNREISRALDITDDTVKNHVYNIFQKTGVKNRNGLVGLLLGMKNVD
ncbi:MAG: LuxR family transcriptional regulator [Spirochaetes bacterium]|nr:MAG: LuxR family transcriptional regulator [Spirochaetota bacterium]